MILDVSMPEMDGFEAASRIRSHARNANTPLIFVTAIRFSKQDRFQGYDQGAVDFLPKPVDTRILKAKIETFVEIHREAQKTRDALDQATRRNREMEAILQVSRTVLEINDFQQSARAIFDACKSVTGATAGYVALLSPDGSENELLFLDSGDARCSVDPGLPMPVRGLRSEAYAQARAVHENDFPKSDWVRFMPPGHMILENVLFSPLIVGDKAVGVLGLANKPGGFTEDDVRVATLFGDLAAMALRNSMYLERIKDNERRSMTNLKLEAVGRLAGGAAHEINTPLQYISGNIDYFETVFQSLLGVCKKVKDCLSRECNQQTMHDMQKATAGIDMSGIESETHEALADIRVGLSRVTRIVTAMKKLTPKAPGVRSKTDIGSLLRDLVALTENQWRDAAQVRLTLESDLPPVYCASGEISQAVLNILENAVEAVSTLEKGGSIEVKAVRKGRNLEIRIQDSGPGIPEDVMPRIFDPFFSTKDVGQGTGQGLALAHAVFQAHGGDIRCESVPGEGATFILRLPLELEAGA
jgi:signal transduction histidine kinase